MEINEQLAERDLVATRKTLRGTHLGELWDLPPTGNRVEFEFIDIFRVGGRQADRALDVDGPRRPPQSDAPGVVTDQAATFQVYEQAGEHLAAIPGTSSRAVTSTEGFGVGIISPSSRPGKRAA